MLLFLKLRKEANYHLPVWSPGSQPKSVKGGNYTACLAYDSIAGKRSIA